MPEKRHVAYAWNFGPKFRAQHDRHVFFKSHVCARVQVSTQPVVSHWTCALQTMQLSTQLHIFGFDSNFLSLALFFASLVMELAFPIQIQYGVSHCHAISVLLVNPSWWKYH